MSSQFIYLYLRRRFLRVSLIPGLCLISLSLQPQSVTRLTTGTSNEYDPCWSANGDSIAFTTDRTGHQHIFRMDLVNRVQSQCTSGDYEDIHPCWLPLNQGIAFSSNRSGDQDMWLFSGPGLPLNNITKHPADEESIDYSADGSFYCYNSNRSNGNWDIWKQAGTDVAPIRLTNHLANDGEPSISPDGTRIAFLSGRNNHQDIWIMNNDGTGTRALTNDNFLDLMPCWHPDGDSITFASNRNGNFDLFSVNVLGGRLNQLTDSKADEVYPAWSPDGCFLAYSSNAAGNDDLYILSLKDKKSVRPIPSGSSIFLDGRMDRDEWGDALAISFPSAERDISARIKHDGESLHIAFDLKNKSSGIIRFPEIMIDTRPGGGQDWDEDVWWFHVSATDCFCRGDYSDYKMCEEDHPGWSAIPNFGLSAEDPPVDSLEVSISLATLGIAAGDTIGLAFDVTNTVNAMEFWPVTASLENPLSWNCFYLEAGAMVAEGIQTIPDFKVYPNPATDCIHVLFHMVSAGDYRLSVFDSQGLKRAFIQGEATLPGLQDRIIDPGLISGQYLITLETASGRQTNKLIIR